MRETNKAKKLPPPPLALAISRNRIDVVEDLLRRGANLDERYDDLDALSLAAVVGRLKIAQLLIDKGANVNAGDARGVTPLMKAVNMDRMDVVHLLLNRGADINAASDLGFSPLIYSVITKNMTVMRLLLDKGADIGLREHRGYSAQDLAEALNYTEMAALLKETAMRRSRAVAAEKQRKLNAVVSKSIIIRRPRP